MTLKYITLWLLLGLQYTLGAQFVQSGVYSTGRGMPGSGTGLYLLKPDSSILYIGNSNNGYTAAIGYWQSKGDSLKIWRKIPERAWTFVNSTINYIAYSKPSYDSVYFDIIITDTTGNRISLDFQLTDSIRLHLPKGTFKGAIPARENLLPEIILYGGNIGGSFYTTKIPLMKDRNCHQINIQLLIFPSKYPFIPLTYAPDFPYLKLKLIEIQPGVFSEGSYSLTRVLDSSVIKNWFVIPRQYNPSFKPYFDWLESEFLKYCCSQ